LGKRVLESRNIRLRKFKPIPVHSLRFVEMASAHEFHRVCLVVPDTGLQTRGAESLGIVYALRQQLSRDTLPLPLRSDSQIETKSPRSEFP
jgi:hypothetical protein